ncbi:MAG: dihydrolipoyl dehydrogenase [Chlamydiota bacterium]
MAKKYDVAIIGSGPGGYVAALRCAQLGLSTVCIEKSDNLGGTCLNVGCIPSKFLLQATHTYHKVTNEATEWGLEAQNPHINFSKLMQQKQKIIDNISDGIKSLFSQAEIELIHGTGRLTSATTIAVIDAEENSIADIEATNIIIAGGSEPVELPFLEFDESQVLSSVGALNINHIPDKLLIAGAGAVGLEMASIYQRLGSQVTVVELQDRIASGIDHTISESLQRALKSQGINFQLSTEVTRSKKAENYVSLILSQEHQSTLATANAVLVAVGRKPSLENLGLDQLGIQLSPRGYINVDDNFRTVHPNIFAIGDLIEGPMLAHKASEEGVAVAEIIAGKPASVNYMTIPNIVYTWPEAASVGFTEQEAAEADIDFKVGISPFKANSRARCYGDTSGMVKIIAEKHHNHIIGIHILGPQASELINTGVMAITKKATLEDLSKANFGHPTLSEALKEAALAAQNKPLHH